MLPSVGGKLILQVLLSFTDLLITACVNWLKLRQDKAGTFLHFSGALYRMLVGGVT